MEWLMDLRLRVWEWRDRVWEMWLWELIPPSPAQNPVPVFSIVLLILAAVLVFIGSFLPWVTTSISEITSEEFTKSGLDRWAGAVTLGYTLVLLMLAAYLWRMGLSDLRGVLLPFIASGPLLIAVWEIGEARDVVFVEFTGGDVLGRIERNAQVGLFVIAAGGCLAVMAGLRVSRAAQQLRKRIDDGDKAARPPRYGR